VVPYLVSEHHDTIAFKTQKQAWFLTLSANTMTPSLLKHKKQAWFRALSANTMTPSLLKHKNRRGSVPCQQTP
jgi:hypothetical protein